MDRSGPKSKDSNDPFRKHSGRIRGNGELCRASNSRTNNTKRAAHRFHPNLKKRKFNLRRSLTTNV